MDKEKIHQEKMQTLQAAWSTAKEGENYHPSLELLNRKQLEEISAESELGIKYVRIVSGDPGGRICSECKQMDGRVFLLALEMRDPHLPNKACKCTGYDDHQTGFCLCYYEIVFEDEL